MNTKSGSIIVGTLVALGLRFEPMRTVHVKDNTALESAMHRDMHRMLIELQEIFAKPSPWVELLRPKVFSPK